MTKREQIRGFLNSIYIPRDKVTQYGNLLSFLESVISRSINKNDAKKSRLKILVINTKGVGTRETFNGYGLFYVDFNHVGSVFAEAYIYGTDIDGLPQKISISNPRYAIIEDC